MFKADRGRHPAMPTYWECERCGHTQQAGSLSILWDRPEECDRCGHDDLYTFGGEGVVIPKLGLQSFVKLCVMLILINLVGIIFGIALSDWGMASGALVGVGIVIFLGYTVGRSSKVGYAAAVLIFAASFLGSLAWIVTASGVASRIVPVIGLVSTGLGLLMLWGGRSEIMQPSGA